MKVQDAGLQGVMIIEPDAFADKRGFLMETYQQGRYTASGIQSIFVQDNLSFSVHGTLRGLHYQHPQPQSKLIQAVQGEVFDVAVDIRQGSPSFGQWIGVRLSDQNKRQLFIPEGFAHGFCVVSETAHVLYKCSGFYAPASEGGVLWCDHDLGIDWPVEDPLLSEKDSKNPLLKDIPSDRLPLYRLDSKGPSR